MIPERRRGETPPGHLYVVRTENDRPVIILAKWIPPDSDSEQALVRQGMREWRAERRRRGLLVIPIAISGGLAWAIRQLHRPAVAAGTAGLAATAVTLALPSPGPRHQGPNARPPATHTPPAATVTSSRTAPHRTATITHSPVKPEAPSPAERPTSLPPQITITAAAQSTPQLEPSGLPSELPSLIPEPNTSPSGTNVAPECGPVDIRDPVRLRICRRQSCSATERPVALGTPAQRPSPRRLLSCRGHR